MISDRLYNYPRRIVWPIESLNIVLVTATSLVAGQAVINLLLTRYPFDSFFRQRLPWLVVAGRSIQALSSTRPTLQGLLVPLAGLFIALLLTILLQAALPAIRLTKRGPAVRFGGTWLLLDWNDLHGIRVTRAGDRFVALVQVNRTQLTGWHRLWSLLYKFGWRQGFLIGSALTNGQDLLRAVVGEATQLKELGICPIEIIDNQPSLLFRLMLRAPRLPKHAPVSSNVDVVTETLPEPAHVPHTVNIVTYDRRLSRSLLGAACLMGVLALWRYVHACLTVALVIFPALGRTAFFGPLKISPVFSKWDLLVGAQIGLGLVVVAILLLYHLFPNVTIDDQGLRLTVRGKTHHLGWGHISAIKATTLTGNVPIVLIETTGRVLPWWYRIGPLLYDARLHGARGVIIWPMARDFEALVGQIAREVARQDGLVEGIPSRLRDDVPTWPLYLILEPVKALQRLVVDEQVEQHSTPLLDRTRMRSALLFMLGLAAGPPLLLITHWMLYRGVIFSARVPFVLIFGFLLGLIEWPLVSLCASVLEERFGDGDRSYSGLYLYPISQLPRLLLLVIALMLMPLGFPNLALGVVVGAIGWSALLAAGFWAALYEWRGWLLVAGVATTVLFQCMTLIAIAVLR